MIRAALARIARRPGVVTLFFLCELAAVGIAIAPLDAALAPVLDRRPAARQALAGDDARIAELIEDHPELGPIARRGVALAVACELLLTSLLAGGILATMVEGDRRGLVAASLRHGPRMIALGLCGLAARIAGALGLFALAHLGRHHPALVLIAAVLALSFGGALASVLLAYARMVAVARQQGGLAGCLVEALRIVARRPAATAGLTLFASSTFILALAEEGLALSLSISAIDLGGALVLLVVLGLGRALLAVGTMVAAGLGARSCGYGRVVPTSSSSA